MKNKLTAIFREVFNVPDLVIGEETTAADVAEWDSFNHLNLIMAIEEEFSISFTTQEIGKMTCVGDMITSVEGKMQKK